VELYLAPSEGSKSAAVTREAVRLVLQAAGMPVTSESADVKPDGLVFWRVALDSVKLSADFQERGGTLIFATLYTSRFDENGSGDRFCVVLAEAGWEVDDESVGGC
jgi:hypothetical protein